MSFSSLAFEQRECLYTDFSTSVKRFIDPLGVFENKLQVDKQKCEITVHLEKFKFIKKKWLIDVCRTPVHIKSGVKVVDVLKRESECSNPKENEYCENYHEIMALIQDEGLIFAQGQKGNLHSDHGKFYCAFQLFETYLKEGMVLDETPKEVIKKEPPPMVTEHERVDQEETDIKAEESVEKEENTEAPFPGEIESTHQF